MYRVGMVLAESPGIRCKPEIPQDCDYLFVGEAPGEQEAKVGSPFQGASGGELRRMISDAGIPESKCGFTNVFMDRPSENKVEVFFTAKTEVTHRERFSVPPYGKFGYIRDDKLFELDRLRSEISSANPKVVIALGATALWALTGLTSITKHRGTVSLVDGRKFIATYHPSYVLRVWDSRVVVLCDLIKARKETLTSGLNFVSRTTYVAESLEDIGEYAREKLRPAEILSVDIETIKYQISCVGIAPSHTECLVIPFINLDGSSYWSNLAEEIEAYTLIAEALWHSPSILFQNGLFDSTYLCRVGCIPRNYNRDTMLKHYALYPELEKGLAFMVSIHCNERAWKTLRPRGGEDKDE